MEHTISDPGVVEPQSSERFRIEVCPSTEEIKTIDAPQSEREKYKPLHRDWVSRLFRAVGEIIAGLGLAYLLLGGLLVGVLALLTVFDWTFSRDLNLTAFPLAKLLVGLGAALIVTMQGGILIMIARAYELLHDIAANSSRPTTRLTQTNGSLGI